MTQLSPIFIEIVVKLIGLLLAVIALGAAAFGLVHFGHSNGVAETTAIYETSLSKQKLEASVKLADAIAKTRIIELYLKDFKNEQDLKDENHQKIVAAMSTRMRDLAGTSGRLRDPNQAGCGNGGGSTPSGVPPATADRSNDTAEAGGLLSAELSGLLQQLAQEADVINTAYASCRADAFMMRSAKPE